MHATPRRHSPSSNGSDRKERSHLRFDRTIRGGCTMSVSALRVMPGIGIAIGMLISAVTGALAQSSTAKDPWPELASNIFNGRPIADGTSMLAIEMPDRAEDACYRAADAQPHDGPHENSPHRVLHHRDRRKPRSGRCNLYHRTGRSRPGHLNPRAGEFLHELECSGRAQ